MRDADYFNLVYAIALVSINRSDHLPGPTQLAAGTRVSRFRRAVLFSHLTGPLDHERRVLLYILQLEGSNTDDNDLGTKVHCLKYARSTLRVPEPSIVECQSDYSTAWWYLLLLSMRSPTNLRILR